MAYCKNSKFRNFDTAPVQAKKMMRLLAPTALQQGLKAVVVRDFRPSVFSSISPT
jgi:hypothetical protein